MWLAVNTQFTLVARSVDCFLLWLLCCMLTALHFSKQWHEEVVLLQAEHDTGCALDDVLCVGLSAVRCEE